eukprot:TRINITY_DN1531_c0_g3_i3.p2 TRINITY_DN1531_c0_g3~~TRINITY_DN1531_c0_g3_i3.p2  ORF type:complete len:212 (+),score=-7.01 TRINITY_DN1531_c0_g3_i3:82-717(+)
MRKTHTFDCKHTFFTVMENVILIIITHLKRNNHPQINNQIFDPKYNFQLVQFQIYQQIQQTTESQKIQQRNSLIQHTHFLFVSTNEVPQMRNLTNKMKKNGKKKNYIVQGIFSQNLKTINFLKFQYKITNFDRLNPEFEFVKKRCSLLIPLIIKFNTKTKQLVKYKEIEIEFKQTGSKYNTNNNNNNNNNFTFYPQTTLKKQIQLQYFLQI